MWRAEDETVPPIIGDFDLEFEFEFEGFSLIFGEEFSLIFGEEFWGKVDSFSLFNEVKLSKRRGREGGLFILLGFSILLCQLFLEVFRKVVERE